MTFTLTKLTETEIPIDRMTYNEKQYCQGKHYTQ